MASPFIDEQDVIDRIGRGGTADDGLTSAVDSACEIVRSLTEQTFNAGTSTITLDGTGTDALVLPEFPAGSVGTVTVNGTAVTDWALKDNGVLVRRSADFFSQTNLMELAWPAGRQNITVTYTHGYSTVPSDVREVALSLASRLVIQGPAKQESNGQQSISYGINSTDLTEGELLILRKHRMR